MKHLLGEQSPEEAAQVKQWLDQDPANALYFNQFKMIWEKSRQLAATSSADENRAWNKFRERIQQADKGKAPVPFLKRMAWKVSAAAAILILAFGILWWNRQGTSEKTFESGQIVLNEKLPDGSEITLNKNSSLSYPSSFKSDKRPVKLKGEAFFKITPDKSKPFIIDINDVQVTVVGTSFNVREDSNFVDVLVETGTVKVSVHGTEVILQAGEKIRMPFTGTPPAKEKVTDQLHNYYRTKEFVCDDTPLWKLVAVLNEAYKTNIVLGREELRDLRMNTTFNNESLDQVLKVISLTFYLNVRKENDKIILE